MLRRSFKKGMMALLALAAPGEYDHQPKLVVDDENHHGKIHQKLCVGDPSPIQKQTQSHRLTNFINIEEVFTSIPQPKFVNNIINEWGDVSEDLIHLLVSRISSFTTLIRFGTVCRFWYSVASAHKFREHVPWLMLSEKQDTDLREFYDLSMDEVYQLSLPEAKGKKILGSAYGWLITVGEGGQFNLLNPINRMQIALPPRSSFQSVSTCPKYYTPQRIRDSFAQRATLVKDPETGDFIAIVIHQGLTTLGLSFCRPSDIRWTRIEGERALSLDSMLDFVQGHLFVIDGVGQVSNCTITATAKMEFVARLDPPLDEIGSYYVVECEGKILLVSRFRFPADDDDIGEIWEGWEHHTVSFRVYKLDLKDKSLKEVQSIGDYALFVGFNSTICLPVTPQTTAYKKNCIYFTDDFSEGIFVYEEDVGGLDMGVFCLDDGSINPHFPGISKSNFSMPIWFVPQLF